MASLVPVTQQGVQAFLVRSWPFATTKPTTDEIRLARMLARADKPRIIEDTIDGYYDEGARLTSEQIAVINAPVSSLLEGAQAKLAPQQRLFCIEFRDFESEPWGTTRWTCTTLTAELALITAREINSESENVPLEQMVDPQVIGVVRRDRLFQSTALLLASLSDWDSQSSRDFGLRGDAGSVRWAEIRVDGVPSVELYRWALFREFPAAMDDVLTMEARDLANFQPAKAIEGFKAFVRRYRLQDDDGGADEHGYLLDDWMAGLQPITCEGIQAFYVPSWPFSSSKPTLDEIRLALMLGHPSFDDVYELIDRYDENEELTEDLERVIGTPIKRLLKAAHTQLVTPDSLFWVEFEVAGGVTSWSTSWSCFALTADLAVVTSSNDSGIDDPPLHIWAPPYDVGVVKRDCLYQSTALLLGSGPDWDYVSPRDFGLRGDAGVGEWGSIRAEGVPPVELYRWALIREFPAALGEVLMMSSQDLVNYRMEGAVAGFEEFVERYGLNPA